MEKNDHTNNQFNSAVTDQSYFKDNVNRTPKDIAAIHDGEGSIQVKSFFRGLTTTGVSFHVWSIPPGASEGRHIHRADEPSDAYEEIYYVLDGHGVLELDDEDVLLAPGDAVLIPVDVNHGVRSSGDAPLRMALIFALANTSTAPRT
jgi:mannose-6-phosphate isomerase-like protein (cupin superfamily)